MKENLPHKLFFENLFEKHLINVCKFEKDENQLLFTSFNLKKINYIFDQATNDYSTCLDYKKSIETFCEKNDLSLSIEYVNWEEVVIHLSFK